MPRSTARSSHGALHQARAAGLVPLGLVASPLLGPAGNREFFIYAAKDAGRPEPEGWESRIAALAPG